MEGVLEGVLVGDFVGDFVGDISGNFVGDFVGDIFGELLRVFMLKNSMSVGILAGRRKRGATNQRDEVRTQKMRLVYGVDWCTQYSQDNR